MTDIIPAPGTGHLRRDQPQSLARLTEPSGGGNEGLDCLRECRYLPLATGHAIDEPHCSREKASIRRMSRNWLRGAQVPSTKPQYFSLPQKRVLSLLALSIIPWGIPGTADGDVTRGEQADTTDYHHDDRADTFAGTSKLEQDLVRSLVHRSFLQMSATSFAQLLLSRTISNLREAIKTRGDFFRCPAPSLSPFGRHVTLDPKIKISVASSA